MIINPFVKKLNRFILGKADQAGTFAELNVSGFDFPTQLDALVENIVEGRPLPPLIILTGNAGDGKSHIIFKIWLLMTHPQLHSRASGRRSSLHTISDTGLQDALEAFRKIFSGQLAEKVVTIGQYSLVKDASAIDPDELQTYLLLTLSHLQHGNPSDGPSPVMIMSINEGILRTQLLRIEQEHSEFTQIVQDLFRALEESKEFVPAHTAQSSFARPLAGQKSALVLNLNTRDIGELLLTAVLDEVARPEQFSLVGSPCGQCPVNGVCPIRFNVSVLGEGSHPARKRLATLFAALNLMGQHVTLRETLSVIAQTLTGNTTCSELQQAYLACENPLQLTLGLEEDHDYISTALMRRKHHFLLQILPYLFFNSIFVHTIRQEELWKPILAVPLPSISFPLSEEQTLVSLGRLDPAGYTTPHYDIQSTFSSRTQLSSPQEKIDQTHEDAMVVDQEVFDALWAIGQEASPKGIPNASWLRSLVIASKRREFFTCQDDKRALDYFPLHTYRDFIYLAGLLKKKPLKHAESEHVKKVLDKFVAALNQFQQPRTVGNVIGTHLELIQQDHFVLFSRISTPMRFELIAVLSQHNTYIEQTQVRVRLLLKGTNHFLDCDLLLYEMLNRFVDGTVSLEGIEPRATEIENFLTKLRSDSLNTEHHDEYRLVGKGITFSVSDGQISVQEQ